MSALADPESWPELITQQELCRRLGVSRWLVQSWVRERELPGVIELPGGVRRYDAEAIHRWVRQRELPTTTKGKVMQIE